MKLTFGYIKYRILNRFRGLFLKNIFGDLLNADIFFKMFSPFHSLWHKPFRGQIKFGLGTKTIFLDVI
jgi:uncharacterized membrane protein (DUF4010 family)